MNEDYHNFGAAKKFSPVSNYGDVDRIPRREFGQRHRNSTNCRVRELPFVCDPLGFFGTPDTRTATAPQTRGAQIARALVSPFTTGDLNVRLPVSPLNIDGQQNSKRYVVGGRMELKKIPPGTYVMQIIVSDTLRKDKSGIAAQALDFEVQD